MKEWSYDWEHKIHIITPKGYKRLETDIAYTYFQYYRSLGFRRSFTKVAEHFGVSVVTIKEYAEKYNWQARLDEEQEYLSFIDNEDLTEKRSNLLKFNQEDTEQDKKILLKLEEVYLVKLGMIPDPKTNTFNPDPNIDIDDATNQLTKIMYMKSRNRDDGYRAHGLPKNINDNQRIEHTGELEISTRLKKIFDKKRVNDLYGTK